MATGLSRLTEGAVNRDQVTRLLACRQQTEADLWAKVKPLLRRIQSQQGILILIIPLRTSLTPMRKRDCLLALGSLPATSYQGYQFCF